MVARVPKVLGEGIKHTEPLSVVIDHGVPFMHGSDSGVQSFKKSVHPALGTGIAMEDAAAERAAGSSAAEAAIKPGTGATGRGRRQWQGMARGAGRSGSFGLR